MLHKLLKILLLSLVCFAAKGQSPTNLPNVNAPTAYYNIGWSKADSGIINALRDTTVRSRFAGLQIMWQHAGVDTNVWFHDGVKYFHYLKTGLDVTNALGYIPLQNITGYIAPGTNMSFTGAGTLGNPYVLNASGGGGGGGNIVSINTLTAANQFIVPGSTGSDFNIQSVGATITINIPTASASTRGLLTTTDWANFNSKQPQLNGTGFVKATGTTISYDNSTYYLASNPSSFIARTGLSNAAPATYNPATGVIGVDTTTGLTHLATQAFVLANQASGTITGAGNLPPLFTTSTAVNTIVFTASNAAAFTVYGNFTSGSAVPTFGKPSLTSAMFANQGTTTTVLTGNAAGNLSFGLVNLTTMVSNTLPAGNGGTGNSVYTVGDLIVATGTTTLSPLSDAGINNVLLSGGVGIAPSYGRLPITAIANISANTLLGNPTGSPAGVTTITLGYGLTFTGGTLAFDSARVKDTIFTVNGLQTLGAKSDSVGLGGRLYLNTTISGANAFDLTLDSFVANSTHGFRVNFGSDAPWDIFVRDSATGRWTRIPKGTPQQSLQMLAGGGIGWAVQAGSGGGGVNIDAVQTYTSGTTLTQTTGDNIIQVNPASTQATLTITTATTSNWHNSNDLWIIAGGTVTNGTVITTLSIVGGAGLTLIDDIPPNTILAGHSLHYHKVGSIIYRMKD